MPREWYAKCKDCGKEYGYSDDSYQVSALRGLSRPERCPECRKLHSREIASLGLSHFELTPVKPLPQTGLQAGRLGGLIRPERIHEAIDKDPTFDLNKFGIKDTHICEYFDIMITKQVTVVVAPTGAGKSTFLPYRLMVPPSKYPKDLFTRYGQIVITQPRIQATRNIPLFVARDLHGSNLGAGFDVGFRHSGSPSTDWRNKMVYMTDGTLINMIIRNELDRLSVIMIDEAHERSINIDLILGLLKTQLSRFPKLKLIIASATINAGMFLKYFGGPEGFDPDNFATDTGEGFLTYDNRRIASQLKDSSVGFFGFPGKRQYPVDTRYRETDEISKDQWSGRMPEEMAKKVLQILSDIHSRKEPIRGDILGFLNGEAPIKRAVELIRAGIDDDPDLAGQVDVLPLYTNLPQNLQDAALLPKKDEKRLRVIISTNVAETSLTVHGIVHVVDSGLINESQWDSKTQTSFVIPKIHSQAGCKQRWGRGGRIQAGVAHCLYTEAQFNAFPEHTDPEIMRAPLDQIVLTAKAAGIDDIGKFEWIQNPSKEELDRAPRYLQQIGAVDEDGDLTEHGLELQSFGEDIDIANLMILADRYGCAVEMATLLPMCKIGGYTKLLLWDKGWDAHTKRSVQKIHQGLLRPCLDDLEYSLKMWQAWEGIAKKPTNSYNARKKWSEHNFVNNQIFMDQIAPERELLLNSLSGHKKEQTYRPVDFDLLTRLRIIMTYGLPNKIYILKEQTDAESEIDGEPAYEPYIPKGSNPELEALHADAVVAISPESICSTRAMYAFVCGQRQRIRRRYSPLSDPVTEILASFLTVIKKEWLDYLDQPLMQLTRSIAKETRHETGKLIATTTSDRLFIDQKFPVGATFRCQAMATHGMVQIGQLINPAPLVITRKSNEEFDTPVDIEHLEAEKPIRTTGVSEEDQRNIVESNEDPEVDSLVLEILEDDEDLSEESTIEPLPEPFVQEKSSIFQGRIVYSPKGAAINTDFNAFVTGYDFCDDSCPKVELEIPDSPTPFEKFSKAYKVGDTIGCVVDTVEEYVNDRLVYLVVREEQTGLVIILDPYDASLGGRNFAIRFLQPGDKINLTVEDIDDQARRVKVSRLKQAEEDLLQFLGKDKEQILEGMIVEVSDNGLYVWLNPNQSRTTVPLSTFVFIDRLPPRPEEMYLYKMCKIKVQPLQIRKEFRRGVGSLSKKDLQRVNVFPYWDGKLNFDEVTSRISTSRRINYEQRIKLLNLTSSSEFQKAVNFLYRRSNDVFSQIIDVTGIQNLVPYQGQRVPDKWKITKVLEDSVFVASPDGFETKVPKREVVFDQCTDLLDEVAEGDEVTVTVKEVDIKKTSAELSLLDPDKDPLNKYQVSQIYIGTISNIISSGNYTGAVVELESGVVGRTHISEIAWWRVEKIEDMLHKGQKVKVRVLSINREERRLDLSMKLTENDPLAKYRINQLIVGKVVGFTKDGNGAFVELEPGAEGYIYKDDISIHPVQDAREALKEGQTIHVRITELNLNDRKMRVTVKGLFETVMQVPISHIGLVIGPKGSMIKKISEHTLTKIDLEDDGTCTIQGLADNNVKKAKQQIEKILETRIVTFNIQNSQVGRLIGKGGETIKDLQNQLGCQIQSNGNQVILTAKNDRELINCLQHIRDVISYCQVTVRVPVDRVRYVIGTGGQNVKAISGLGVRINISKDNSGKIDLEGKSRYIVDQAIQKIESHSGSVQYLSVNEIGMPAYHDVQPNVPVRRKALSSVPKDTIPSRFLSSARTPDKAPTRPATQPQRPAQPQTYQSQIQVNPIYLSSLIKRGGFLASIFGGGKSVLDKIMEETQTQIGVNTSTGQLTISGRSQKSIQMAVDRIKKSAR